MRVSLIVETVTEGLVYVRDWFGKEYVIPVFDFPEQMRPRLKPEYHFVCQADLESDKYRNFRDIEDDGKTLEQQKQDLEHLYNIYEEESDGRTLT